jgi:hypothetical protein
MGKSQRDKGARVERELVNRLSEAGIEAERVPLSGGAGGSYTGDIIIEGAKAEVKARKEGTGFALLYRWLGDNDYLIVKTDRKEPLVVMEMDQFEKLLTSTHENLD